MTRFHNALGSLLSWDFNNSRGLEPPLVVRRTSLDNRSRQGCMTTGRSRPGPVIPVIRPRGRPALFYTETTKAENNRRRKNKLFSFPNHRFARGNYRALYDNNIRRGSDRRRRVYSFLCSYTHIHPLYCYRRFVFVPSHV